MVPHIGVIDLHIQSVEHVNNTKKRSYGPVAQRTEQQPSKLWVVGSNPTRLIKLYRELTMGIIFGQRINIASQNVAPDVDTLQPDCISDKGHMPLAHLNYIAREHELVATHTETRDQEDRIVPVFNETKHQDDWITTFFLFAVRVTIVILLMCVAFYVYSDNYGYNTLPPGYTLYVNDLGQYSFVDSIGKRDGNIYRSKRKCITRANQFYRTDEEAKKTHEWKKVE